MIALVGIDARGCAVSGEPHPLQNLLPGGLVVAQAAQITSNLLPHSLQNFALSLLSCPHWGQRMPEPHRNWFRTQNAGECKGIPPLSGVPSLSASLEHIAKSYLLRLARESKVL